MAESVVNLLHRCRVVLVRTHYAGNIGSVARVMRNFGLRDLVLVDPQTNITRHEARMMAVRGVEILDNASTVATIEEAVADCGLVLATSGEMRGLVRKGFSGTPEEKLPELLGVIAAKPVALVFGPEPHGLTAAEVARCHGAIYIPADDEYASLNLAQAVAVCLYELRKLADRQSGSGWSGAEPPASFADQERAFAHLREGLVAVRFLWDFRADGVFHVLRHLIARAKPTDKEVMMLHGLARQLLHVAKRWGVTHPDEGRPPTWDGQAEPDGTAEPTDKSENS